MRRYGETWCTYTHGAWSDMLWRPTCDGRQSRQCKWSVCNGVGVLGKSAGQPDLAPHMSIYCKGVGTLEASFDHSSSSHKELSAQILVRKEQEVKAHSSCALLGLVARFGNALGVGRGCERRCARWLVEACTGVATGLCEGA